MTYIKRGKLSADPSRLNQNADINVLFKILKIIAHALQQNICTIIEYLDILTRDKKTYNDVVTKRYHVYDSIYYDIFGITNKFGFQ